MKYFSMTVSVYYLGKGPYIKYVGGGHRRDFVEEMKYFRHILMGRKIFSDILSS